jgi:hypothetical protein
VEEAVRVSVCAEFGQCVGDRFDGGNAFEFGVFVEVVGWCWKWDFWDFEFVVPAEESIGFGVDGAVVNPVTVSDAELIESDGDISLRKLILSAIKEIIIHSLSASWNCDHVFMALTIPRHLFWRPIGRICR